MRLLQNDYYWQEMPFVYRVHEAPDDEKIRALATFINNFGFSMHIGANEVRPKEIQKLLGKVEGTTAGSINQPTCACASMKTSQIYAGELRTFWIGSELLYTFTSPIRRYQIFRSIGSSKITCGDV